MVAHLHAHTAADTDCMGTEAVEPSDEDMVAYHLSAANAAWLEAEIYALRGDARGAEIEMGEADGHLSSLVRIAKDLKHSAQKTAL